jgi:hypothetical protein
MTENSNGEYCLIVEGSYLEEADAEKALRDPFIEEYVENTGSFRIHNFDDIEVAGGFSLGDLAVKMVEDEVFEISCRSTGRRINEHKAKLLAEALRRHDMFDDVRVEPFGGSD